MNARGLGTKLIKEIKEAIKGLELNGGRQEKGHIGEIELENVMKLDVGGKRKNRESGEGEKREVRQFIHVAGGWKRQRIRRESGPHRVKRQGGLGIDKEGGESREEREKRVKKRKVLKFNLIPVMIKIHASYTSTHYCHTMHKCETLYQSSKTYLSIYSVLVG